YFARRYHPEWHLRFTYVLSAAFDSGVAFMVLLAFLIFDLRTKKMVQWWGTNKAHCPLEKMPLIPATPLPAA
ncbi:hypothetical protein BGZ99_002682, partial [Dissophora globulifera]